MTLGRRDDEWLGWTWCEDSGGLGGWLPDGILGDGRALAGFDTRELSVVAGDLVDAGERRGGWTRCRAADGTEGWVPDRCLTER